MKTVSRTRKRIWSAEQWHRFAYRCCAVTVRLDEFIRGFPMTAGLTAATMNHLCKAANAWGVVRVVAADACCRQRPELDHELFHGVGTTWAPARGRSRKNAPLLAPDRWVELGREIKAIRAEMMALLCDFSEAKGVTAAEMDRFSKAMDWLDRGKWNLEGLAGRQHPEWSGVTRAFCGRPETEAG